MKSLFSIDGPVIRFLSILTDLMLLNLLWLLCSLPIVTIGASTTAGYYACLHITRGEGSVVRDFFSSFRRNFKQATILWFMILLVGAFLYFDFCFLESVPFNGKEILHALLILICAIYVFTVLYAFPLLAQFDNKLKNTIYNALYLSLRYFGKTILMCLPFVLIIDIFVFLPAISLRLAIVWLFFLFSCPAYICCHILKPVLNPYLSKTL